MLEDGRQIFSANEICRLLCIEAGKESFAGFNPVGVSLVDHWLDWEVRELKVILSSLRRCPYFRGSLYTSLCSWEGAQCPH